LDGERLIRTSGSPGTTGEFRTEKNPFTKIVMTAAGGVPQQFQAWRPNGQILTFGLTFASRLHGNPLSPAQSGLLPDSTLTWYLDTVSDRYQNLLTITYGNYVNTTTATPIELVPVAITYGQRSVGFAYNGAIWDTAHTQWINGMGIVAANLLNEIWVSGPDSTGATVVLRSYRFGYNSPTTTGATLLSTITECDARGSSAVCKRPTTVTWESGGVQYGSGQNLGPSGAEQKITDLSLNDVSVAYRRIIPVDLNNDGMDDIIYRAPLPGPYVCVVWMAQLAVKNTASSPPSVSYGAPQQVGLDNAHSDQSCGLYVDVTQAYAGDVAIVDLNNDGFPDMISPVGNHEYAGGMYYTNLTNYEAYFNQANPTTFQFGPYVSFEGNSSVVALSTPTIAAGDLNGDGIPEVLRPTVAGGDTLWAGTVTPSGTTAVAVTSKSFSDGSTPTGFWTLDIDGDGITEVMRDSTTGKVTAASPTISALLPSFPGVIPGSPPSADRWILDLNGDGRPDVAWVTSAGPTVIHTLINTGTTFQGQTDQTLPPGYQIGGAWTQNADDGVRVIDFNEDGRQDLLLVDNGAGTSQTRSSAVVLLSNGNGGFTPASTTIPIGDPADGVFGLASPYHGYRTTVVLDANGDGLPDVLQNQGGNLYLYLRQGNVADMVTGISEGTGRKATVTYSSLADPNVYSLDPATCSSDRAHLSCVNHAWVTSQLEVSGGEIDEVKQYTYTNGVADKWGRGFLGFTRRDIFTPDSSKHTEIDFNPTARTSLTASSYVYPYAFVPVFRQDDADTSDTDENFYYHHEYFTYTPTVNANGTFSFTGLDVEDIVAECELGTAGGAAAAPQTGSTTATRSMSTSALPTKQDPAKFGTPTIRQPSSARKPPPPKIASRRNSGSTSTTSVRVAAQSLSPSSASTSACTTMDTLRDTYDTLTYDGYGNLLTHGRTAYDDSGAWIEQDSDTLQYVTPVDEQHWLVSQLKLSKSSSATPSRNAIARTISYVPDPTTGDLDSYTIEPGGDSTVYLKRTFIRLANGEMGSISDTDHSWNARNVTYAYQDADGVYPSGVWDSLGNFTKIWRHPGYGYVVEVDDPNQLAAVTTYDTFGRVWSQAAMSGASTTITYNDLEAPPANGGVDFTISPEGKATRAVSVHLNPFGQETQRIRSIDSRKKLSTIRNYDVTGRLIYVEDDSIAGTASTLLNFRSLSYDDLDRPQYECHEVSDGTDACAHVQYDWQTATRYDESGRWKTTTFDFLGRLATQETSDANGNATLTRFDYSQFGQLAEVVSDDPNATSTMFGYDVRGRLTSTDQSGTGSRLVTLNAFGDTTQSSHGSSDPGITYVRDVLGRVTSMTGVGLSRTFTWDALASGQPAANGIGHLNDVTDSVSDVSIHYDYGAQGLLLGKKWTIPRADGASMETYAQNITYDTQGRPNVMTYPLVPGEASAFAVSYVYDDYTGTTSSITDTSNPSIPVWKAGPRNEWGSLKAETMTFQAKMLTRVESYYLPEDRLFTTSLSSGSSMASLAYTYEADGLPHSLQRTTPGGSRTETFDYDNLGQLTSWWPDTSAPLVTYAYDQVGRLTSRSWTSGSANETVSYNAFPSGNTSWTVQVNGGIPDIYVHDSWGRVKRTPALRSIGYDANDEVTSLVEASNNQSDTIIRDPFGSRVLTVYGSSGSVGSLVSLDDVYELKRVGGIAEGRCRLRADGKLVGDIVTTNGGARTATFYLANLAGTIVAEGSSATGGLTARSARDPFGNLLSNPQTPFLPAEPTGTNPDGSSRVGYGDHEHDPNWGVVDMVARFYSPRLGRFMSPDSAILHPFDRRDYDPFAYVWNRPTMFSDPDGHAFSEMGGGSAGTQSGTGSACSDGCTGSDIWNVAKAVFVTAPTKAAKWTAHEATHLYCSVIGWGCSNSSDKSSSPMVPATTMGSVAPPGMSMGANNSMGMMNMNANGGVGQSSSVSASAVAASGSGPTSTQSGNIWGGPNAGYVPSDRVTACLACVIGEDNYKELANQVNSGQMSQGELAARGGAGVVATLGILYAPGLLGTLTLSAPQVALAGAEVGGIGVVAGQLSPRAPQLTLVIGRLGDTAAAAARFGYDRLDIADWSLQANMLWIRAGIEAGARFYLATPITGGNLVGPYGLSVYARELLQLGAWGLVKQGNFMVPGPNWLGQ
jgi:RHS repeat-associated protein